MNGTGSLELLFARFPLVQGLLFMVLWGLLSFALLPWRLAWTPAGEKAQGRLCADLGMGFCVGSVLFGTLAAFANWAGILTPRNLLLILSVWACLGGVGFYLFLAQARGMMRASGGSTVVMLLPPLLLILMILLLFLPSACVPFVGSDDHKYHVSLLRLWFQDGSSVGPHARMSAFYCFPLLSSQVASVFVPLFGYHSAQYVQLAYLVSAALLIYGVACQLTGRVQLSFLGAVSFVLLPLHFQVASFALADRGAAALGLAALCCLLTVRSRGLAALVCFAACAAGAAATKHHLLFLMAAGSVAWGCREIRDRGLKGMFSTRCVMAGLVAALVLLPWYGRSYLETGNPVFPLLLNALPVHVLDPGQAAFWNGLLTRYDFTFAKFGFMWWGFTTNLDAGANNILTVLMLPIVLLAFFRFRANLPAGAGWLLLALFLYVGISIPFNLCRYRTFLYAIEPALLLLCFLSAYAVGLRAYGLVCIAILNLVMLLPLSNTLAAQAHAASYALGRVNEAKWISQESPYSGRQAMQLRHYINDGDAVAVTFDRPLYYPGIISYTKDWTYATKWALPKLGSPSQLGEWFRTTGVDVAVIDRALLPDTRTPTLPEGLRVGETEDFVVIRKPAGKPAATNVE